MTSDATAYEHQLEYAANRSREQSKAGREIGPLPEVVDPARKEACRYDLLLFLETYLGPWFFLGWADFHLELIAELQRTILTGTKKALAKPRASGKTTISIGATVWALVYGHRRNMVIVAATGKAATRLIERYLKPAVSEMPLLLEDFPEVIYPIWKLEGSPRKADGQILNGERTKMSWKSDEIVFPTVEGSPASGTIVECSGITGAIRGAVVLMGGVPVRPDLLLLDDPQTDDSAKSKTQTDDRMRTINSTLKGLVGPGSSLGIICPCTVMVKDDLADQLLDREKNPSWYGTKTRLMDSMPTNEDLWDEYRTILANDQRADGDGQVATDFYAANQEAMDEGAIPTWPDRFEEREISAVQYAMNLFQEDEVSFFAEYQNEPLTPDDEANKLTTDKLLLKLNGAKKGEIGVGIERLTMFIDVMGASLYWMVVGWDDNFGGQIIDWQTFPRQRVSSYGLRSLKHTFSTKYPDIHGQEAQWFQALTDLTDEILGKTYERSDGQAMKVTRCLIDYNDGNAQNTIESVCNQSEHKAIISPADTISVTAGRNPIANLTNKTGTRLGLNWRQPPPTPGKPRKIQSDGNFWKSFARERLLTPQGAESCVSINGNKKSPAVSMVLINDLCAESSTRTEGRGRVVDEWSNRPGVDNHYWDCLVGCSVAASMEGCKLPSADEEVKAIRSRMRRVSGKKHYGK